MILLRGGFVSAADLLAAAKGTPAEAFVTATPNGIVLSRPLAIWSDAGLTLGEGERLVLNRSDGSFVANLGWLDMEGGAIIGTFDENRHEAAFRPFVVSAGQGSMTARGASFSALGFGTSPVFGGVAVVNNGLKPALVASHLKDSSLADVTTVAMISTTGATLAGNLVKGSTGTAILVSHGVDTTVARNRLTELAGPQGVRVTAMSDGVQVAGNLLSGAARTGILMDSDSTDVTVAGNLVAGSLTTGIGVDSATCVTVADNLVTGNGGSGISLRDTDRTVSQGNAILFNEGSGVLLRDQTATAEVHVIGNTFIGNRSGLRGATPGNATIRGNALEGQMPRVFAGDLATLTVEWLRDQRKGTAPTPARTPTPLCAAPQGDG